MRKKEKNKYIFWIYVVLKEALSNVSAMSCNTYSGYLHLTQSHQMIFLKESTACTELAKSIFSPHLEIHTMLRPENNKTHPTALLLFLTSGSIDQIESAKLKIRLFHIASEIFLASHQSNSDSLFHFPPDNNEALF